MEKKYYEKPIVEEIRYDLAESIMDGEDLTYEDYTSGEGVEDW